MEGGVGGPESPSLQPVFGNGAQGPNGNQAPQQGAMGDAASGGFIPGLGTQLSVSTPLTGQSHIPAPYSAPPVSGMSVMISVPQSHFHQSPPSPAAHGVPPTGGPPPQPLPPPQMQGPRPPGISAAPSHPHMQQPPSQQQGMPPGSTPTSQPQHAMMSQAPPPATYHTGHMPSMGAPSPGLHPMAPATISPQAAQGTGMMGGMMPGAQQQQQPSGVPVSMPMQQQGAGQQQQGQQPQQQQPPPQQQPQQQGQQQPAQQQQPQQGPQPVQPGAQQGQQQPQGAPMPSQPSIQVQGSMMPTTGPQSGGMPHPATLQPGALPGSLPSQSMPPNMVPAQLRMGHPGGAPPAPSPYMQPQFMQGGRPPPMHNGGRMPMPMGPTAGQQQMSQQVPPQPGQPAPQGSGQPPPGQQQQQQPMMQPGQPQIMQQPKPQQGQPGQQPGQPGMPMQHMGMQPQQGPGQAPPQQQQQGPPPPGQLQQQPGPGQGPRPDGTNKSTRDQMIDNIMLLLQQRKSSAANVQDPSKPAMESRLRDMAVRLEKYLWERSNSDLNEYSNTTTLKQRLQALAMVMNHNNRRGPGGQQQPPQPGQGQPPPPGGRVPMPGQPGQQPPMQMAQQAPGAFPGAPGMPQMQVQQPRGPQGMQVKPPGVGPAGMAPQMGGPAPPGAPGVVPAPQPQVAGQQPKYPQMPGPQQHYYPMPGQPVQGGVGPRGPVPANVAMNGTTPGHPPQQPPPQQQPQQQVPGGQRYGMPMGSDPNMVNQGAPPYGGMVPGADVMPGGQPRPMQPQQPGMPQQPQQAMQQGQRPLHTPEQRQQILHQQQQRLLYLRHASKCQHENDKCPQGYNNCQGMKQLWQHIASCREQRCPYPHCVSSRYVLSHYHKCKDERCPVCGPVRNTIRNSNRPAGNAPGGQQPPMPGGVAPAMAVQPGQPGMPMPPGIVTTGPAMMAGGAYPGAPRPMPSPVATTPTSVGNGAPQTGKSRAGRITGKRGAQPGAQQPISNIPPATANSNTLVAVAGLPGGPRGVPATGIKRTGSGSGAEVPAKHMKVPQAGAPGRGMVPYGGMARGPMAVQPGQQIISQPAGGVLQQAQLQRFEDSVSLVNSFTDQMIEQHMSSLRVAQAITPTKIKQRMLPLIMKQLKSEYGWIFEEPVDPIKLQLPDYFDVIKNPMDLGTIRKRLEGGTHYDSLDKVAADVKLTFDNAMLYNPPGQEIHKVAKEMKNSFFRDFNQLRDELNREHELNRRSEDRCLLCGNTKLYYEPPLYYCNGQCNGNRIRRNSYFYSGGRNQYHWCLQCYADIKEETIQIGGATLRKSELIKEKNDRQAEEPWVQCDDCQSWLHQVCALFNGRNNQAEAIKYYCPECTLKRRQKQGTGPTCAPLSAKDLKHNSFSKYIEERVHVRLEQCFRELADQEGRPYSEAEKDANPIFVRQVLATDKVFPVRERFFRRYHDASDYPTEFPAKSKCLVLFQNLDGVDVILFAMYVYEYGINCPLPNNRRTYISYLDSVHYFRPREFRTAIYHEILIAYLAFVRQRGFHTAHIWACPPYKGDDYILHCHPTDQKVPREDRLRKWYQTMLETARDEGIVDTITTLYDEHFRDPTNDATVLPYMEGDYWIGEAENLIKEIEDEEKDDPQDPSGGSKKRKAQKKKANKRTVRRLSDGTQAPGYRDPLMERLGSILDQMKDSFIVARLQPMDVIRQLSQKPEPGAKPEVPKIEAAPSSSSTATVPTAGGLAAGPATSMNGPTPMDISTPLPQQQPPPPAQTANPPTAPMPGSTDQQQPGSAPEGEEAKPVGLTGVVPKLEDGGGTPAPPSGAAASASTAMVPMQQHQQQQAGGPPAQPGQGGQQPSAPQGGPQQSGGGGVVKDDVDVVEECEIFDTRSEFLDFCKGNHYQFDELRRAKHTSMMVLYHLMNPDAPKFLPMCCNCNREINGGWKYTCNQCEDEYSMCPGCYQEGYWRNHLHPLQRMPIRSKAAESNEPDMLRQKEALRRHLELLVHSCTCKKPDCVPNCIKMRELLQHVATCKIRSQGGCKKCRRVWLLLQYHAKSCKNKDCLVPKCPQIREALRMRQLQQLQMEERRRAAQNQTIGYRAKPAEEEDEEESQQQGGGGGGGVVPGKGPAPPMAGGAQA